VVSNNQCIVAKNQRVGRESISTGGILPEGYLVDEQDGNAVIIMVFNANLKKISPSELSVKKHSPTGLPKAVEVDTITVKNSVVLIKLENKALKPGESLEVIQSDTASISLSQNKKKNIFEADDSTGKFFNALPILIGQVESHDMNAGQLMMAPFDFSNNLLWQIDYSNMNFTSQISNAYLFQYVALNEGDISMKRSVVTAVNDNKIQTLTDLSWLAKDETGLKLFVFWNLTSDSNPIDRSVQHLLAPYRIRLGGFGKLMATAAIIAFATLALIA
jgi:hypothetical protein